MTHSIYRFVSPSGKSYVGQTKRDPETRKYEHLTAYKRWVRTGRSRSRTHTKFFYALDKYPASEWTFEVLHEGIAADDIDLVEQEFIAKYDSFENGYNGTAGGMGLKKRKLTVEHRKAQSEARKAYYDTPEGQADLEEKRRRFQENNPSKPGREAWNKGIPFSEETKAKLKVSNKASWTPERRAAASKRMCENNPRKKKGS